MREIINPNDLTGVYVRFPLTLKRRFLRKETLSFEVYGSRGTHFIGGGNGITVCAKW